jgi:hypothetical protein
MWLAASESKSGEDLRQRILDYLAEGDVTSALERLVDRGRFHFSEWISEWEGISTAADAREWRSGAARLLTSYPDHPGLLASRGLAEALDPEGDLREFELNLTASIRSARIGYGSSAGDIDLAVLWMLRRLQGSDRPALAVAFGAAQAAGHASDAMESWLEREAPPEDVGLGVLIMRRTLKSALDTTSQVLERLQEVST